MYSFEDFKWIEEVILHLVTSSTWCAQALFLRIGASPCQITKMCFEKQFVRFSKSFQVTYFSAFWRLYSHKTILDPTAVKASHQAVEVSLGG